MSEEKQLTPGVILKSKFILANNKTFQKYIDYVDREEAQRNKSYEKYSTYSEEFVHEKKSKEEHVLRTKQERVREMTERIIKEKEICNSMQKRMDTYNNYVDYLSDFDSIPKMFLKENECFSWTEKKELRELYRGYSKELKQSDYDYVVEEKALENYSSYVDYYVQQKQEKLQTSIEKKHGYLTILEARVAVEKEKVIKLETYFSNFDTYNDYMSNPEKTSALFTESSNALNGGEKKELKELFSRAQKNGSVMWQDVISFDNEWLEEHGVYDKKTHRVDEKKLMDITRLSVKEMQKRENVESSSIWSAAIHYNTENIHIHIAMVEPNPTRKRGKRKPKTLSAMKGKVVNNILDRKKEQTQINDLIRKSMVAKKENDSTFRWNNRELKPIFLSIYEELPSDKRQWQYGYNTLNVVRPSIDELSKKYIEKYYQKDYEGFMSKVDREAHVYDRSYGKGAGEKYKQGVLKDLYKRMGNSFLKEMRVYDKQMQRVNGQQLSSAYKKVNHGVMLDHGMKKVGRAFRSEYENWKNQKHYEQMQEKIHEDKERG